MLVHYCCFSEVFVWQKEPLDARVRILNGVIANRCLLLVSLHCVIDCLSGFSAKGSKSIVVGFAVPLILILIFVSIVYWTLLFFLGGRVAVFLALELNMPNAFATRFMDWKHINPRVHSSGFIRNTGSSDTQNPMIQSPTLSPVNIVIPMGTINSPSCPPINDNLFRNVSETFTYILGLSAVCSVCGIIISAQLSKIMLVKNENINSFLAMSILSNLSMSIAFLVFLLAKKSEQVPLMTVVMILILISLLFYIPYFFIDIKITTDYIQFCRKMGIPPIGVGPLIGSCITIILNGIIYYGFLILQGGSLMVFMTIKMNKSNFFGNFLRKYKRFQPVGI